MKKDGKLRVAFLGNRGVPAKFGGSDTVFEQLGERLVRRGHTVIVYCRRHNSESSGKYYKGIERIVLPSLNKFNLDTLSHSFISTLHAVFSDKADILNYHGIGNSLLLPLLFFSKKKSVVVIDGPDWKRPKWNILAKMALRLSVNFAVWFADEIISDNVPIREWIRNKYMRNSHLIFYGAETEKIPPGNYLAQFGLKGGDYLLFVAMMVPDKGPDLVLEAYSKLKTDKKLLMVGDTHTHIEYFNKLKYKYSQNKNIIFTGFQYGDSYREFMSNAYIYTHPFRSDGTSPSLLQALAFGNCIVANSSDETVAALEDAGILFERDSTDSMVNKLQFVLDRPYLIKEYREKALKLFEKKYQWDSVVSQYENVFKSLS